MEIRKVPVSEINPAPYNPRVDLQPGDPDYEQLKFSIETFGYIEPLVWNQRTKTLVSGHQRFKILIAQGAKEIEVSIVDLSLVKEKQLNLILNQRNDWDEKKLAAVLGELSAVPNFDLTSTGFELPEISNLFDKYFTPDLDAPEPAVDDGPPITKRGDLIHLGSNVLSCGDASSSEALNHLLGNRKVHLLYTDPPYNCRYDPTSRPGQGEEKSKWRPIANDWAKQEDYEAWLGKFFQAVKPHLSAGAPAYIWNGHRQFGPMHSILIGLGFHVSNVITWVKPSAAPSYGDYWMGSEFCLYAWLDGNGAHRWFGPKSENNVWEVSRDAVGDLIHLTQKPVALAQRAIRNSSQRGDLVFDGFAGSGSTLIAAQSMDRICYAMELEPSYCDCISQRFIRTFGRESVSPEVFARYGKEASHE